MTKLTVTKAVCVNKYTRFDPKNPSDTAPEEFALIGLDASGYLGDYWMQEGYVQVGVAQVEITLQNSEETTKRAVVALKKKKESVIAKAQAEATEIERKIQTLLAITYEG